MLKKQSLKVLCEAAYKRGFDKGDADAQEIGVILGKRYAEEVGKCDPDSLELKRDVALMSAKYDESREWEPLYESDNMFADGEVTYAKSYNRTDYTEEEKEAACNKAYDDGYKEGYTEWGGWLAL